MVSPLLLVKLKRFWREPTVKSNGTASSQGGRHRRKRDRQTPALVDSNGSPLNTCSTRVDEVLSECLSVTQQFTMLININICELRADAIDEKHQVPLC